MTTEEEPGAFIKTESPVPPRVRPNTPKKKAVWPVVLGIVAILFAVFGTLGVLWQLLAEFLPFLQGMQDETSVRLQEIMKGHGVLYVCSQVMQYSLLAALWVMGIGMVRRRPWGVTAGRIYGWGTLLAMLIGIAVFAMAYPEFSKVIDEGLGGVPAGIPIQTITLVFSILGFLWQLMIGVGLIAWLGSQRVRGEWMTWSQPG
ncbi:MAG: hypothetical protein MK085_10925 [Phycisphaerales bacterium]|nr:hypothetical protein [Phycisphaerales bacterium]